MNKTIWDVIKGIIPLSNYEKRKYNKIKKYLENKEAGDILYLLRLKKINITEEEIPVAKKIGVKQKLFFINTQELDDEILELKEEANKKITQGIYEEVFVEYAKKAGKDIPLQIAPNIVGMEIIKKAMAIQLFAKDRFHVLLLGDPGTGKTDIIRSASDLSPISSFGLGSGVSGVGLAVAKVGKEIKKGLLVQANNGLCAIDELNLMKKEDRASLYNAMEKGFVSLDKGGIHETFEAKVRIAATANPLGDKIRGTNIDYVKRHLPFDPALLSRFHLVFLIKRPSTKEFLEITKKIIADGNKKVEQDKIFYKSYVKFALTKKITFPKKFEPMIVNFVEEMSESEEKFIVEISPRLVIGLINMAKARARMELREKVSQEDIKEVLEIQKYALDVESVLKKGIK